ncbi:MAG: 30S ribosomal protein S16 [bacterium]|nr:30S ribosomal protein S16 [bacterium]
MSVKIRLSRIGKKKEPFFRIVAIDSRSKRDGRYLANIGTYDVLNSSLVTFHKEVYDEWVAKGALPTDSAKKIYRLYKRQTEDAQGPSSEKTEKKVKKAASKVDKVEQEHQEEISSKE